MPLRSLLPKIYRQDFTQGVDEAVLKELNNLSVDLKLHTFHEVDEVNNEVISNRYLGPVTYFDFIAEQYGQILWTETSLATWGESKSREILATFINNIAGTPDVFGILSQLFKTGISYRIGRFNKRGSVNPDDWEMIVSRRDRNGNRIERPYGIEVLLVATTPYTPLQVNYFYEVIPRLIPYFLVDLKITILAVANVDMYVGGDVISYYEQTKERAV